MTLVVSAAVAVLVAIVPPVAAATSGPVEGSAGIDTGLPATDSAVTVSGRGPFSNLRITVNQTRDLVNQVISVDWTGGAGTQTHDAPFSGKFDQNFLQMFECWGAADGTNPQNPGPPPQQCEFGAQPEQGTSQGNTAAGLTSNNTPSTPVTGRELTLASSVTYTDPQGNNWLPFDAANGAVIPQQSNFAASGGGNGNNEDFWLNPYFDTTTSNEVNFALTSPNGTGSQAFTVDTGVQAPGLGCGQAIEPQTTGRPIVPQCWLVIVPRGSASYEDGSLYCCGDPIMTSPLNPASWENRIAIPLGFQPVNSACSSIGATPIIGGELSLPAVANWTPLLCATPGDGSYGYTTVNDNGARQDLLTAGTQPDMGVFDQPIDPSTVAPSNPLLYAPISLSGAVIAFNIDRIASGSRDVAENQYVGTRVAHMYLTPRLIAKLLTESYSGAFFLQNLVANPAAYAWDAKNPRSLLLDPDFLQYNPEFKLLTNTRQAWRSAALVVEQPTSDAAQTLWRWVLADPEAAAWLAGHPDPWGMVVNPYYSTNPQANPEGVGFASPLPNNYPQSDPYCVQAQTIPQYIPYARKLCIQDWDPYSNTMQSAAQATSGGDNGSKTTACPPNCGSPIDPNNFYQADGADGSGQLFIMSITDAASAAQYGLDTASLSRAGDDRTNRTFVAADRAGLTAGAAALQPTTTKGVLQTNVSATAPGAYPLTMVSYAAVTPASLSIANRKAYATFLSYAGGPGQVPGVKYGTLPPGYAPLPAGLRAETMAAAAKLAKWGQVAAPAPRRRPASLASVSPSSATGPPPSSVPGTASAASGNNGSSPAGNSGATGATRSGSGLGGATPNSTGATGSTRQVASLAARSSPTPSLFTGAIKWVLPIALGIAVFAGLLSWQLSLRRGRRGRTKKATP
jgi:hypothetical protein